MVQLHEQHLCSFVKVWRKAKELNIELPETTDTDYQSLETLLRHVLRAARGYMTWMCKKLELPIPLLIQLRKLGKLNRLWILILSI